MRTEWIRFAEMLEQQVEVNRKGARLLTCTGNVEEYPTAEALNASASTLADVALAARAVAVAQEGLES